MTKKKYYQRPDGLFETSRTVNGKRIFFRGKTCAEVDRKILAYSAEKKLGRKVPIIADEWFAAKEEEGIRQGTYRPYYCAVKRIKKAFPMAAGDVCPRDIKRYIAEFEGKVEEYRGEDYLLGMMLLYTGCRRGELLALNWQDIDRKAGTITINKKLNYEYGNIPRLEHFMKNRNRENNDGSGRVIPLLSPLAEVLPNRRLGLIFHNEDGQPLTAAQLSKRWKTYCRNTGLVEYVQNENGEPIPTYPITPHCFRHSFTTICYEAGLDVKTMAAFIGDTEQVTTTVYAELRARHHASGAERVNAYLAMRAEDRANSAKAE